MTIAHARVITIAHARVGGGVSFSKDTYISLYMGNTPLAFLGPRNWGGV